MNLIIKQDKKQIKMQKVFSCFYPPIGVNNNYWKIMKTENTMKNNFNSKLALSLFGNMFMCQEKIPFMDILSGSLRILF